MRNGLWAGVVPGALAALLLMQQSGYGAKGSVKPKHHTTVITGKHIPANKRIPEKKPMSVQIVSFPETGWQAVKVIRGGTPAKDETAGVVPAEKAETAEVVTFEDPSSRPVRVVRGDSDRLAKTSNRLSNETKTELVTFADPRERPVTVLRGSIAQSLPGIELFRPASEGDLDRVAFAVDGAESS